MKRSIHVYNRILKLRRYSSRCR